MGLGTFIFVAYVIGAVLKLFVDFMDARQADGRPFNWQYLKGLITTIITGIPAIAVDFMGWLPAFGVFEADLMILLAFGAGYGASGPLKTLLENLGTINKALNKASEYDEPSP